MFIVLGVLAGILGFIPLYLALLFSKRVTPISNIGYGAILLLGVFGSLVILALSVLICYFCFEENIIEFVFSAALALIILAIVFGIVNTINHKKTAKERKEKINKKSQDK